MGRTLPPLPAALLVAAGLLLPLSPPPLAAAPPAPRTAPAVALAFPGDGTVVASGLAPGAEVLWLGVALEPHGAFVTAHVVREIGLDAAGGGEVVLAPAGLAELPVGSAWAVLSLADGAVGLGGPAEGPLVVRQVPPTTVAAALASAELTLPHHVVELAWLRPGTGAWTVRLGDGTETDADGLQDGSVRLAVADLAVSADVLPLWGEPVPPSAFAPGDVVVALDPERLEAYALTLGSAELP